MDIKIEDFMDVVYRCKFCPYSCTQSPDMSLHVKDKHLRPSSNSQLESPSQIVVVKSEGGSSESSLVLSLDAAVSEAVVSSSITTTTVNNSINVSGLSSSSSGTNFNIQESEDVLGFTTDGQAFMEKSLTGASFAPLAVPVSQGEAMNLSNTSTPDLTELINFVKPSENRPSGGCDAGSEGHLFNSSGGHLTSNDSSHFATANSGHMSVTVSNAGHFPATDNQLAMASVVQLQPGPAPLSSMSQPFTNPAVVSANLEGLGVSQPYTVMAIHLPNLAMSDSNSLRQYVVNTPVPEPTNIPEHSETKEFLLCGLCKLAFTTMEECQAHMQTEHKELMHGTGVSIGVQAGGAKRGRKRKSEQQQQQKIRPEPYVDPDDLEWLPSVVDNNRTSYPDGRVRRKIKPPRALKEDYVLGKRMRKRMRETCVNLGYKIVCPMMSCKAKFKSEIGLHIHMACHNLHDTAFTCKECQSPHEFWKQLRMHLWRAHKVDCDLFTCEHCSYKTDTHHKMNIHKEIHTDAKPYTCDVCGKGFRQASQMKNHQVTHLGGKSAGRGWFSVKTCDICDRVFANSKCLKKHKEAVHTNYKPFECMYCNHTTARKAMMELHIRTHTGEKPFKCDICPYSTGDHNSLRRHKMRHTGQKQYRCTQCTYTCIQSISLKQHMRHKHPGTSAGIFQCARCSFRTINQAIYINHMQDHKKGLIPDKLIPPRLELPKAKKVSRRSQGGSSKRQGARQTVVEPLLIKHPQFHAVMPGDEPSTLTSISGDTTSGGGDAQAEVFNMQVTMLPEGDTQISAEDMNRLSESPGLLATGIAPLQLIYATLSTISEQGEASKIGEGRSSLLTAQLIGGIHTAVLSSMQDGVTVHSVTYHLPKVAPVVLGAEEGSNGKNQSVSSVGKADESTDGNKTGSDKINSEDSQEETEEFQRVEVDSIINVHDMVAKANPQLASKLGCGGEEKNKSGGNSVEEEKSDDGASVGRENRRIRNTNNVEITSKRDAVILPKEEGGSSEKAFGSSTLREMLESGEKVTVLNTESGEVRLITVDFLDPSLVSDPETVEALSAAAGSELQMT